MKELEITRGECICKNERIYIDNKLIATCWVAGEVDETRLEGESWIDMRNRTESERENLCGKQPQANATLFTDAHNTAQKCGLLPSELLQQRDELREALEEQKRLYFNLFDEETSCMYCEAKIRRGSAIILCKECAENTEI